MRKQMCDVMFGALKAFMVSVVIITIIYTAIGMFSRMIAGW